MNLDDVKPRIIKELEVLVALYTSRLRHIINSHTCVGFERIEPEAVRTLRISMESKILEVINNVSPNGSGLMAVEVLHADEASSPEGEAIPKSPKRPKSQKSPQSLKRTKSPERTDTSLPSGLAAAPKAPDEAYSKKPKRHGPKEDQPKDPKKRRGG